MIQIQCLFSPAPRQVVHINLSLPLGSLVRDALVMLHSSPEWMASQALNQSSPASSHQQGIWGRLVTLNHGLKDGDRLEIYRPLLVDPKLARKQRFKRQGKGRTGLFARRRKGAVAGY
jgi:uncharacterized protein